MKKRLNLKIANKYYAPVFIIQVIFVLVMVPLLYTIVDLNANSKKSAPESFHKTEIKAKEINNTIVLKYKIAEHDEETEISQMCNLFFPVI